MSDDAPRQACDCASPDYRPGIDLPHLPSCATTGAQAAPVSLPQQAIDAAEAEWRASARTLSVAGPREHVTRLLTAAAPHIIEAAHLEWIGDAMERDEPPTPGEIDHLIRTASTNGYVAGYEQCRQDHGIADEPQPEVTPFEVSTVPGPAAGEPGLVFIRGQWTEVLGAD